MKKHYNTQKNLKILLYGNRQVNNEILTNTIT